MGFFSKIWMTQKETQAMRRETEKNFYALQLESEQELGLSRNSCLPPGRTHGLYLGYVSDHPGQYEKLFSIAVEIIEKNLKDYFVFTRIRPPCATGKSDDEKRSQVRSLVEGFQSSEGISRKYFYDGDVSFITYAQGADVQTLKTCCASKSDWAYDNDSYGFCSPPLEKIYSYEAAFNFMQSNVPVLDFSYHDAHVALEICFDPQKFDEMLLFYSILSACEKHREPLHFYPSK